MMLNCFQTLGFLVIATLFAVVLTGCDNVSEQTGPTSESNSDQSGASSTNVDSMEIVSATRQITVSPETTHVEGPLDEKGVVDFIQALNEIYDPEVTPEENAAVALCQLMGSGLQDPKTHAVFMQRIGVDSLPMGETGALAAPAVLSDQFIEQQSQAMFRPWTVDEFPQIASWIDRISSNLDICVEAVERPVFYLPMVDSVTSDEPLPPLVSVLMPVVQNCRGVSRGLAARSMLNVANGDEAGARRDILAMFRLARHLSDAPVIIQSLVGMAIESQANACLLELLNSGLLNGESASEWLTALDSLPAFKPSADILETGERLTALDLVQAIKIRGPQSLSFFMTVNNDRLEQDALDWNAALRVVNDWYDQIVTSARTPDYPARIDAIARVEQRLQAVAKGEAGEITRVLSGGVADPQSAGNQLGNLVSALTIPAATQVHVADTRREMQSHSTILALQLFHHHASQGEFPATISNLDVEIPLDLFTLSDLKYQRDDGSITAYSRPKPCRRRRSRSRRRI